MAGALLAQTFRQEFRRVIQEMEKLLAKMVNSRRSPELSDSNQRLIVPSIFKSETISNGLR